MEIENSGDFLALVGEEVVALGGEFLDGQVQGLSESLQFGVGLVGG